MLEHFRNLHLGTPSNLIWGHIVREWFAQWGGFKKSLLEQIAFLVVIFLWLAQINEIITASIRLYWHAGYLRLMLFPLDIASLWKQSILPFTTHDCKHLSKLPVFGSVTIKTQLSSRDLCLMVCATIATGTVCIVQSRLYLLVYKQSLSLLLSGCFLFARGSLWLSIIALSRQTTVDIAIISFIRLTRTQHAWPSRVFMFCILATRNDGIFETSCVIRCSSIEVY